VLATPICYSSAEEIFPNFAISPTDCWPTLLSKRPSHPLAVFAFELMAIAKATSLCSVRKLYFEFDRASKWRRVNQQFRIFFCLQFVFLFGAIKPSTKDPEWRAQISFPVSWTLCSCCWWHSCCIYHVTHTTTDIWGKKAVRKGALRAPSKRAAALISFLLSDSVNFGVYRGPKGQWREWGQHFDRDKRNKCAIGR